jgi:hypothetical protein
VLKELFVKHASVTIIWSKRVIQPNVPHVLNGDNHVRDAILKVDVLIVEPNIGN